MTKIEILSMALNYNHYQEIRPLVHPIVTVTVWFNPLVTVTAWFNPW